ncbi:YadA-like family protein [Necropsobacter massiliensis]|uniref:YadA-like family protein n=1 Tax=Necropsobacter massiliensis TaxID=1400001 RepID=UPI001FE52494|nr:YadA-like family protein [Necropsobacter massiliensis]
MANNAQNITNNANAINTVKDGLNATNATVANNTQNITNNTNAINTVKNDLNATNTNVSNNAQDISKNAENIAKGIQFGNGTKAKQYQLGDTLNVTAGNNNLVSETVDGGVKLSLADNITVSSVTAGGNVLNTSGLTVGDVKVAATGIDAGHQKITNVANGTELYDAVTMAQLTAATVLLNAGNNTNITSQQAENGVTTYTINANAATVLNASEAITVKSTEKANNVTEYAVDLSDTTKANITQGVDAKSAVDKGLKFGNGTTNNTYALGDELAVAGDSNIISTTTKNGVGLSLAKNITVESVTAGGNVFNTSGLTIGNVQVNTDGISAGSQKITNVANGTSDNDAVNFSQLNATNQNITNLNTKVNGGFGLQAEDGQNVTKQLGDKIEIVGGNTNLNTIVTDGKIAVNLNNTLNLGNAGSVIIGDVVMNNQGLTISGGPRIVKSGIDAGDKKITNVTAGEVSASSTEAVNGSQLYQTNQNVTNLNTEVAKGWTLTTSGNTTGKSESKVGMGAVVTLDGGNNINLTQTGNTISIATTTAPTFTTVTTGDTTLSDKGLTIQNGPNITKSGIDAGDQIITRVKAGENGTDAVNKDQLDAINATATAGWNLTVNSTDSSNVAPNATVDLANKDGNIVITKANNNVTFALNENLTIGGKNGKDGKIGLDGTNGTIGLTGPKGADGADGASANITVQNGQSGINGQDGDSLTRIVYTDKDGKPHQVATLEDGLKFAGNQGDTIAKQLGETLDVVGALANNATASANNIRIDSENGKLVVKIAENPSFTTVTTGDSRLSDNGLTITGGPSITKSGINGAAKQINNIGSGLQTADGDIVKLTEASGDVLKNAVNVGDLKNSVSNLTSAQNGGGFGLTDDNGTAVKQDLGKTIQIKGKDGVTVTADTVNKALEVALAGEVSVNSKDGKDGAIGVKDADGKDSVSLSGNGTVIAGRNGADGVDGVIGAQGKDGASVVLNGKDGSIGLIGPKGEDGTDGASASIRVVNGAAGLDGNDGANGESKTRILYEKPNGAQETVATLNDGLNFTGNNEVVNAHKLNSKINIIGEGVDKTASENFASAAGNINVKADGSSTLTVQLAKDLNLTATGSVTLGDSVMTNNGLTITNGPSITKSGVNAGNKVITHVAPGVNGTDAVNKDQLDAINATATAGWNLTVNSTDSSNVAPNATVDLANKDGNIVITKANNNVTFALNENLTIGGKNGKDGKIGLDGTNGTIGLTGPKGTDGTDGASANITVQNGQSGINGQDGDSLTRIVYTDKDGNPYQVATLEDGLKFAGNQGEVIKKQLGQTLKVAGSLANEVVASSANVRVDSENGELVVKIAENPTFTSVTTGDAVLSDSGLIINHGPSITKDGINVNHKQITNLDSGLKDGNNNKVALANATGDMLNNGVNVADLKEAVNNITSADSNGGFGLTDDNGIAVKQDLGKTIQIKGKDGVTVTANKTDSALEVGLAGEVSVNGKDGKDGAIGVKGADGKDGVSLSGNGTVIAGRDGADGVDGAIGAQGKDGASVVLNGKDGSIGLTGPKGEDGTDGASASIRVVNGAAGLDGNDGANGESKTRILYEKPNGAQETVATLNDGLNFTGNNEVVNVHKLNSKVNIIGEGVDKTASENFASAAGNINVKADGSSTLTVQLAKDLNLTQDGSVTVGDTTLNNNGLTIAGGPSVTKSGINVGNKQITNLDSGLKDSNGNQIKLRDATGSMLGNGVNVSDLKEVVNTLSSADGNGGFGLKDDNGTEVKQDLGKTIQIKGKDGVTVTANKTDSALEVGLAGEVSVNGKDGQAGTIGVKGTDGKDGVHVSGNGTVIAGRNGADGVDGVIGAQGKDGASVVLNGKDGSIGLTGAKGADGRQGAAATIQVKDGQPVADGSAATRIVYTDGSSVTREIATMDDGLKFAGNNGVTNTHKLNTQVNIVGEGVDKAAADKFTSASGNINVKANGSDTLTVQLAKDVNLTKDGSVTVGETKISNDGLTVQGGPSVTKSGINAANTTISNIRDGVKDNDAATVKQLNASKTSVTAGNNVKVTTTSSAKGTAYQVSVEGDLSGISSISHGNTKVSLETDARGGANVNVNNATITHVAPGVNPTDAVNKGQLDSAVNNIGNHINKVDKDLRGGIAGALASAGLYHATLPGRSMVSAGAGAYRGESAVAIGYSRLSDNGKMGVKFSINTNTRGDTGAAASIGYQW